MLGTMSNAREMERSFIWRQFEWSRSDHDRGNCKERRKIAPLCVRGAPVFGAINSVYELQYVCLAKFEDCCACSSLSVLVKAISLIHETMKFRWHESERSFESWGSKITNLNPPVFRWFGFDQHILMSTDKSIVAHHKKLIWGLYAQTRFRARS